VGFAVARVSTVNPTTAPIPTQPLAPPVLLPPATPPVSTTPWGPIGGFEANKVWLSKSETALRLTFGGTAEQYVDPILQVAGPRGSVMARVSLLLSPFWTCGAEAGFATSLSSKPLQFANSTAILDETLAYASLPVRYRASDELVVEFGGRWLDRAPHLAAPNFAFHQRQLWFYVTLYGTTRRQAPWIAP
jgi:hypothetical protein